MDYELKNGYKLKLGEQKGSIDTTYMQVKATGYHGDMDYDVNKSCRIDFNEPYGFKDLIAFSGFLTGYQFEDLKEEYRKLFKDDNEFSNMVEEWEDYSSDYSEMHDNRITLDMDYYFVIEGKIYASAEFDFFNEE